MSLEAMLWALKLPAVRRVGVSDAAHLTLIAMANPAHEDGRYSFQSAKTLADIRDLTVRTVRRHLEELETSGLIVRGDQSATQRFPANRRPVVWDLAISTKSGVTRMTPQEPLWGDTHDTPEPFRGDTPCHLGVTPDVTQHQHNPTSKSTYLSTDADAIVFDTIRDRDCIHGASANYYDDRKSGKRLPECPYCRKIGAITLQPIEEPANA